MTSGRLRVSAERATDLVDGFAAVRAEQEIPAAFPTEVEDAAAEAAAAGPAPVERRDLREVAFVTVDPPGSRDLDQALAIETAGAGHVIRYAIADVGAFVPRGGVVEAEAWRRGVTLYSPDLRTPLYPASLSEGAASLLPDGDRPAVVFTIPVSADGTTGTVAVERAMVRSRARLTYGEADEASLPLLAAVGRALGEASAARGAGGIEVPDQEVRAEDGGYTLGFETRLPQEGWNAEVSLAANMAAARIMWEAGVGLFRVMDPTDPARAAAMARVAAALGLELGTPADLRELAKVQGPEPARGRFLRAARRSHGASYRSLPPADAEPFHAAVAAPYAHATAPLRRLADRYVLDLLLTLAAAARPTTEETATIQRLPEVMGRAEGRADRLESACIDLVETAILRGRVGESFAAVVTGATERGARVQLRELPVRASVAEIGRAAPGDSVTVRLDEVDPLSRTVRFVAVAA